MKTHSNIIITAVIAILAGLGIGYLLFGKSKQDYPHSMGNPDPIDESNDQELKEEIWTCSMHPQVRQNEPGLCPICEMDLIPLEANTSNDPLVLQMTEEAVKLASIQTTVIGEQSGETGRVIMLSGKVQADERRASSQVAHVPGRIEKLFVTFTGEYVAAGSKLATLYSPDLITAQKELLEAIKLQSLNPKLVTAARNKLRFWKISDATIEAIEQRGEIQENFDLYAGESGVVTQRRVAVGDYVQQGEPLFDLVNLSKVWVLFDAYEEDLAHIRIGDRIAFSTPSISNKTFKTKVTFIDPMINPDTRVASIRTEINNRNRQLKPEMFVNGSLEKSASSSESLSVPKSAVLWTGTRSVVYVKVPDMAIPSFQFREIEIGDGIGNHYLVLEGLEPGEEVVTQGSFVIDAAAQLNNQASMMNRNVSLKGVDNSTHLPDYTESTPVEFKQQLSKISDAYILMKNAFVATDAKQGSEAAKTLLIELPLVDMSLLKGDAHLYWMEQLSAIQSHSEKISELDDVEEQRKQFDFLSQALIKSVKVFGVGDDSLYVEHCPMAFDNTGADWLSKESEIRNPYFGDKMMKCGIVKDTITKDFKNPPMKMVPNKRLDGHKH